MKINDLYMAFRPHGTSAFSFSFCKMHFHNRLKKHLSYAKEQINQGCFHTHRFSLDMKSLMHF